MSTPHICSYIAKTTYIHLEVISDCLITAKLWPLITLPTFGTHLLATHRLHLSHHVRVRPHRHCQHHQYRNYQNALRFHFHLFGGILDKEASLSFWVFLGCVFLLWFGCDVKEEVRGRGESWIEGLFFWESGVREWLSGVQVWGMDCGLEGGVTTALRMLFIIKLKY